MCRGRFLSLRAFRGLQMRGQQREDILLFCASEIHFSIYRASQDRGTEAGAEMQSISPVALL